MESGLKWVGLGLAIALLAGPVVTVPDRLSKDRVFVTEGGRRAYEIRKDPIIDSQYQVRDRDGNRVGTWKQDPLFPDRYRLKEGP